MRNLTSGMSTGFSQNFVVPHLLGVFEFESGTLGMWTGLNSIEWNGITFYGGGNLIGISPIEETQELQAKGVVLSLNGISPDLVATSLTENVKNRALRIYLALLGDGIITDPDTGLPITDPDTGEPITDPDFVGGFLSDPYRIFSGLMDTFEFTDDGTRADIRLSVENILLIGQRSKVARYTDEEQKKRYTGDKGLEFINRLQDREIVW